MFRPEQAINQASHAFSFSTFTLAMITESLHFKNLISHAWLQSEFFFLIF